jgi:hypothetical protein
MDEQLPAELNSVLYYCPQCRKPVRDPLVCQDCLSVICRTCGSPLEREDELGIG